VPFGSDTIYCQLFFSEQKFDRTFDTLPLSSQDYSVTISIYITRVKKVITRQ
jgi:hypothetical protein